MLCDAGRHAAGSFGLVDLSSPAKVCVPLFPTYAIVTEDVAVSWRCTAKFHASIVGKMLGSLRIFALSPTPMGIKPLAGTVGKGKAAGPLARLNAAVLAPLFPMNWLTRTGRFCVTTCPKTDPNTPISKLRP